MTWQERFWKYIKMGDECWTWTGANTRGYGVLRFGPTLTRATHLAVEIATGRRPAQGEYVIHSCDNPACVNPAHLRIATPKENAEDRESKGRGNQPKGERHGRAKLTDETVRIIRREYAAGGIRLIDLARRYKVHHTIIMDVIHRRTWRHVD